MTPYNRDMHFWEIAVASGNYHGHEALTYSSEELLSTGSVVRVHLRNRPALGIVLKEVKKPTFEVKPISEHLLLPPLPHTQLALMDWLREYYPAPYGVITNLFMPANLPKTIKIPLVGENILPNLSNQPPLTADQAAALEAMPESGSVILHGQTGTGKTRAYIELAAKALKAGKSSVILTPEISLTSQLAKNFEVVFGPRVLVIHSQLTTAARRQLWLQALTSEEPLIVIGPRSALFTPLREIGLIVIDEAHETAYKQDQAPYYHASRVAAALSEQHGSLLILGSATPPVSDYFLAEQRGRPIIQMSQTATPGTASRDITVVDLKDRSLFPRSPYFSQELIHAMKERFAGGEQTLLFLNRRGTARVVFCEDCGWQATCPNCDIPLVYHGDTHRMRCHGCSFSAPSPSSCPDCHKASVVFRSVGTKAIVDEAQRLFPEARIRRFDTDNHKEERMEQQYSDVHAGNVDIIVGTQTLAKGLDLPKLTLVGVLIADSSLFFPDFSASERTFQLLSQVIGRVGRGHLPGQVIIQTYNPASPILRQVITGDWDGFYHAEIKERETYVFPPFCYLLKLTCRRARAANAEKAAETLVSELRRSGRRIRIEGPAPAFHERAAGKYQWQIIIKARDRQELTGIIKELPSGWTHDIDPMNLL